MKSKLCVVPAAAVWTITATCLSLLLIQGTLSLPADDERYVDREVSHPLNPIFFIYFYLKISTAWKFSPGDFKILQDYLETSSFPIVLLIFLKSSTDGLEKIPKFI